MCIDTETTGLATAAGTLAFLVGLARWEGDAFCQTQLLLPDHADEPALLAEIAAWVTPDSWLVSYNGRGFDWPLVEARFRLAGRAAPAHAGHLDLLPFVRRVFRHRMVDARLRTVEGELLGISRIGDVEGWEIPSIYLDVLRGGPVDALAGVVIHNEKDVRSLGLLLAHVERRYADRAARHDAPRGDLAGLARAYGRGRRHEEALACLDDALASAPPVRDPFGRTPVAQALARERLEDERDAWWEPRIQPTFGGRPPRTGWRGPLANGRGGPIGPAPGVAAWETGGAWDAAARWTDERLAAERARLLRRLGRWTEAAEAWQTAAAAGDGLGVIAWIEVAKLREHRLADPGGALAATRAAWRLLERLRVMGRAHPRLEADLQRRGARLSARLHRRGEAGAARRPAGAACLLGRGGRPEHPAQHRIAGRHAQQPGSLADQRGGGRTDEEVVVRVGVGAEEGRVDVGREHAGEKRVTRAHRIDEAIDGDRRPGATPGHPARGRRVERDAACRPVGQQHRRAGSEQREQRGLRRPRLDVVPSHADQVGPRDDRRRPGRMLGHGLTRDQHPEQALPAEGDLGRRIGDVRPGVGQLGRDGPEQPAAGVAPARPGAPRDRPDQRPGGHAGSVPSGSPC